MLFRSYGSNEFDFTTLSCEGRAYKALFATAIAIHRKEYDTISKQVKDTLDRIKKVKRITPALREEIRVLKISVDAQIISVAGEFQTHCKFVQPSILPCIPYIAII